MVGEFATGPPPVQMIHYPTFLNVDYIPEDTHELDEINQRFQRFFVYIL
jgi:hypothetical protein